MLTPRAVPRSFLKLLAEGFYSAFGAIFRFPGTTAPVVRFVPPAAVSKLGYPAAKTGSQQDGTWFTQDTTDGAGYTALATARFSIASEQGGPVRIRDNFGGRTPTWSRDDVKREGDQFVIDLKPGESVEATLPAPDAPPPKPANASMPLELR